ncbi:FRIGIDA-like protein 2 [Cucurbita pepo subsp. pepo]|uniref:FRIGIDA-like protein 2 n=1 Tax=Cucurbita pepo subsp. pepo TaxID=3664 RepID=UPI000C9D4ACC|nr:FRIGIDA-like protein 2 [Cucurbita pepo subsp. pepo]
MADLKEISDALKLVDSKTQNLKKAFEDLQGHSHLLDSFSLSWSDLESHFTSIQNSLTKKFHELESMQLEVIQNQPEEKEPCSSLRVEVGNRDEPDGSADCVSPRSEMKLLCEQMDGKGLGRYVSDLPKERESVRDELPDALKCAPDIEALVLDAMEGFFRANPKPKLHNLKMSNVRRGCVLLLETLMDGFRNVDDHVTERAKKLALDWKQSFGKHGKDPLDALGFLHLVAAYNLSSEFEVGELVDYFIIIARYRQATKLCKVVGLGDKVYDLVQKLLDKGKQLLAVKFIFEFELTDRFPPIPILKEYVRESKKAAKAVCRAGKNSLRALNESTAKELGALKSVVKFIEEYKLDDDYPQVNLQKRIDQLEKQRTHRKRPAIASPVIARHKQPHQPLQVKQRFKKQKLPPRKHMRRQFPINHLHMAGPGGSAPVPNIVGFGNPAYPPYRQTHLHSAGLVADLTAPYQQSLLQPAGLLPNHPVSYAQSHLQPAGVLPDQSAPFESSSMAYNMAVAASTPAGASYHGSSAEYYGLAGGPMGFPGNASTSNSHAYPTEPYAPPGYGAGVPPPYHQSYYPQ